MCQGIYVVVVISGCVFGFVHTAGFDLLFFFMEKKNKLKLQLKCKGGGWGHINIDVWNCVIVII